MDSLIDGLDALIHTARSNVDALETAKARMVGEPPAAPAPVRRRRRKQSTARLTRADQALALVIDKPGITAAEIAKTMRIKSNYVYGVMAKLQESGAVVKDGRTYSPVT